MPSLRLTTGVLLVALASSLGLGRPGAVGQGPLAFAPTWESLAQHRTPRWYADAKFGIYFHWGLYSVPAFGSEWYSRNMYQPDKAEHRHHVETFGPVDRFGYKDFASRFTAERFDPAAWAALFEEAGARFAGPVAEHADGFSLWDSRVNPWNAAHVGPKRDLVGALERAIRRRGLKFVTTFHHQWLWGWYSTPLARADVRDPANGRFYGPVLPPGAFDFERPDPKPTAAFEETWRTKLLEVIDRYKPDVVYLDSRAGIIDGSFRQAFLAHYYNEAHRQGREVVMTYKNADFPKGTGVVDIEQGRMASIANEPWQIDDTIDWESWAYLERPRYKPTARLVHELVDVVSKNGTLLLDIGPRPDGTIPEPIVERLRGIGAWLRVNGEAIYGTRPWTAYGEGPTEIAPGTFGEAKTPDFTSRDIRFTTKGPILYAIVLGWPEDGRLLVRSLGTSGAGARRIRTVQVLGHRGRIDWDQQADGLFVQLPTEKPSDYAVAIKIH
jgi:alpha-L-fucosidase